MRVATNGIELEAEVLGERGEPLVLIMGIGTQLIHWPDEFCAMLVERGFRVVRFDNRDVGRSTRLEGQRSPSIPWMIARAAMGLRVRTPYTLYDMAGDVAGLIEALDFGRAHVMGISMGGMIAQCLAVRHPERVRSLVSMSSTTGGRYFGTIDAYKALFGPTPTNADEAEERGFQIFEVIGSRGFERDAERLRSTFRRSFERGHYPQGFLRQFAAIVASGDREAELRGIRAPTLVLHGADDPLIPPAAGRATASAIPGAELEVIEGLAHDLPDGAWPRLVDRITTHCLGAP